MNLKEKTRAALIECGVKASPVQLDKLYEKFVSIANESVEAWVNANEIIGAQRNGRSVTLTRDELFIHPGAQVVREATYIHLLKQMKIKYSNSI